MSIGNKPDKRFPRQTKAFKPNANNNEHRSKEWSSFPYTICYQNKNYLIKY